jgi:hypothetical protein
MTLSPIELLTTRLYYSSEEIPKLVLYAKSVTSTIKLIHYDLSSVWI